MTLPRVPFFTGGGAEHDAEQTRLALTGLISGNEGVTAFDACTVRELAVPGDQVRITNGGLLIRGRISQFQGIYSAVNVGDHNVSVPATGASPRNDLLVVRVEDPQYEGTLDPLVDNIVYPQLLSNVPAGTRTLEDAGQGGLSAVPLARIEIPASTATITDDLIVDVRELANARQLPDTRVFPSEAGTDDLVSSEFVTWPAIAEWTMDFPSWVTRLDIMTLTVSARLIGGSGTSAQGNIRVQIEADGNIASFQLTTYELEWAGGITRETVGTGGGSAFTVGPEFRGKTVTIRQQGQRTSGTGNLLADLGTTTFAQLMLREGPVWP